MNVSAREQDAMTCLDPVTKTAQDKKSIIKRKVDLIMISDDYHEGASN